MKRFLFLVSALLIAIGAWSQASITLTPLPDNTVGKALTLTMNLCNTEDVKAFQCDLSLPETVTFNDLYPTLTDHTNGFEVAYRLISDRQMRIVVSSGNLSLISPDSAAVARFSVAVSATVASDSMTVSNAFVVFDDYRMMAIPDSRFAAFTTKPSFIVSYISDGVELHRDTVVQGEKITPPSLAMDKEGYAFDGWDNLPEIMPDHDIMVNALYTKLSYHLVFTIEGDTISSSMVAYNDSVVAPIVDAKEGYTFDGWIGLLEIMPAKDVTVTGSYTVNRYKLTYMVDGAVFYTDSVAYGTTITAVDAPEKLGSTFSGWSEIPETMPAEDVVITGSFVTNGYTLTYILDGKEYKSTVYEYGSVITVEEAPTKEGYTFSGWSEIPVTMPAEDVKVTGSFTVNEYQLTYTVDGEVYYSDSIAYGTTLTAIEAPTREGYTFSGWSEIPETMPAEDVIVTGSFTVNEYQLTYTVDGEVYYSDSIAYGTTLTAIEAPTREGYTFSGWSEIPATMPAEDVVVPGSFILDPTQTDMQGLEYTLNESRDAFEVTGYNDLLVEDLLVPEFLYELPVVSVGSKALMGAGEVKSIVVPESVTSVGEKAFYGCSNLLVVEWNTVAPLSANIFDSPSRCGNMMIYVADAKTKVEYQGNVVVAGVAEYIKLVDELPFRNTHEFTARNITFTRDFTKKTKIGMSGGWEALVLPFDVQRVVSKAKGELKPFGESDFVTSLPYWLGELQADGTFTAARDIVANKPFIMQLPNSDEYEDMYNVEGEVTFSATEVTVHITVDVDQNQGNGYSLLGSYEGTTADGSVYALNDDEYMIDGDTYMPGGVFVANIRDIRPFEAYVHSGHVAPAPYLRIGGKGATSIGFSTVNSHSTIYDLTGRKWNIDNSKLPKGIYIINNNKVIIK